MMCPSKPRHLEEVEKCLAASEKQAGARAKVHAKAGAWGSRVEEQSEEVVALERRTWQGQAGDT